MSTGAQADVSKDVPQAGHRSKCLVPTLHVSRQGGRQAPSASLPQSTSETLGGGNPEDAHPLALLARGVSAHTVLTPWHSFVLFKFCSDRHAASDETTIAYVSEQSIGRVVLGLRWTQDRG
jgi:hypothetical protein